MIEKKSEKREKGKKKENEGKKNINNKNFLIFVWCAAWCDVFLVYMLPD